LSWRKDNQKSILKKEKKSGGERSKKIIKFAVFSPVYKIQCIKKNKAFCFAESFV
jgi:hypothetical protein